MNHCPITYEECGDQKYSKKGLHLLSRQLLDLKPFPFTPEEQIALAIASSSKLSIQGVQPKLSVILNVQKQEFEIVEKKGKFILKPQNPFFIEVPENEDVTMRLAKAIGIEVPVHGLVYNIDGTFTYFIKRFDRVKRNKKIATEDFAQVLSSSRETKYDSSIEKVIGGIEKYCTFPNIEKLKLFRSVIFSFLVGNEDMHLKNFSIIRREDKVELSPAYDLLNTTIIGYKNEESALPLKGKKSNWNKQDLFQYFAKERLGLNQINIDEEMKRIEQALPKWNDLLERSFLSTKLREAYAELIQERWNRISI